MRSEHSGWQTKAQLRRIRSTLWANVVEAKLLDLARALKANFDPNQPRVPAGSPDGGEWTRTGAAGATSNTQVAQNPSRGGRSSGQVRLRGGQVVEATPAQEARLAIAQARAARTISQVRELDPNWRPTPSLTETIEGEIAAAEAEFQEAETRLRELAQEPAENLIEAFRQQQGLDLLGDPIWSRGQNSVAVCKLGEQPFLGVNSQALTYSDRDNAAAERIRDSLVVPKPHEHRQHRAVSKQRRVSCGNDVSPESGTGKWWNARR